MFISTIQGLDFDYSTEKILNLVLSFFNSFEKISITNECPIDFSFNLFSNPHKVLQAFFSFIEKKNLLDEFLDLWISGFSSGSFNFVPNSPDSIKFFASDINQQKSISNFDAVGWIITSTSEVISFKVDTTVITKQLFYVAGSKVSITPTIIPQDGVLIAIPVFDSISVEDLFIQFTISFKYLIFLHFAASYIQI